MRGRVPDRMESKKSLKLIVGVALLALSVALLASLATHSPHEGPFPDFVAEPSGGNACGVAGAYASAYGLALLGYASYLVAAAVGLVGAMLMFNAGPARLLRQIAACAVITVVLVLGLAVLNASPLSTAGLYRASSGTAGGAFGILLAGWLYTGVGATGTSAAFSSAPVASPLTATWATAAVNGVLTPGITVSAENASSATGPSVRLTITGAGGAG